MSRHNTSTLSDGDADRIINDAVVVLRRDGSGDTHCVVGVQRDGSVTTFTEVGGVINSQADFNTVIGLPGYAKVVNQINWCGAIIPNVMGCAPIGGSSFVVVRFSADQEGILWAHEFGHTKGLFDTNVANEVMNGVISAGNRRVTSTQCDSFRR